MQEMHLAECGVLRKFGMEGLRGVMPRLGIRKDALFGSIANYHPPPQILPPGEEVRCRLPDGWRVCASRPYALAPSQARAA